MSTTPQREQWHAGEEAMHRLLHVPHGSNPTIHGLPQAYGQWMAESPLLALGTSDRDGRIWTTLLGGAAGVTRPVAPGVLVVTSAAHLTAPTEEPGRGWVGHDPVLEALFTDSNTADAQRDTDAGDPDGHRLIDHGERGKLIAGLAMNLEERTRVKLAGRMIRGIVLDGPPNEAHKPDSDRMDVQLAVAIDETLGNCPKYLNRKVLRPHEASPTLIDDSLPLPPEAVALIEKADIFFLSSRHGDESMDTNNRGGSPGFVRVFSNSVEEGVTLVYPEYSGNRLFQTLGNLHTDPAVGITVPDFETGDVLYLTGTAEVLIGGDADAALPHSTVAVRIRVDAARFVRDGLPFRGRLLDPSPYNPPVRRLAREIEESGQVSLRTLDAGGGAPALAIATLVDSVRIAPTVSRHTFQLSPAPRTPDSEPPRWRVGEHVTMDFSGHLDRGWSHMRDHDPTSLNDDFIRSFTISSAPGETAEFTITVRDHGPVTRLLARWTPGAPLTASVLGIDAGAASRAAAGPDTPSAADDLVVVAGGIGITPMIATAPALLAAGRTFRVLWSLRAEDLPLAVDVMNEVEGLAAVTTLFITPDGSRSVTWDERARLPSGTVVHDRRLEEGDVLSIGDPARRRFIVCAGPTLRTAVLEWTSGEKVELETFDH